MNSQILIKINNFIKNRLIELSGASLILISIFLLASIVSYSPSDPNFIYTPENIDIKNVGGFYGSALADFLLQSIGLIVFLVILNLFVWGFKLITQKGISNFISQIFFSYKTTYPFLFLNYLILLFPRSKKGPLRTKPHLFLNDDKGQLEYADL